MEDEEYKDITSDEEEEEEEKEEESSLMARTLRGR